MNANILIKITALITLLFPNRVCYAVMRQSSLILHYRQKEVSMSPISLLTHANVHKSIHQTFTNRTFSAGNPRIQVTFAELF